MTCGLSARAGEPLTSYNTSVTGQVIGDTVTFQVGGELGAPFGSTFTGTLDGDALKLNVPQSDGQQQVMVLTPPRLPAAVALPGRVTDAPCDLPGSDESFRRCGSGAGRAGVWWS